MAKGLNKHTPNSDELLKRLETNDSSGLDDFEKEALEGFDSLENVELAKNLTDSLNKKIDEKYLNKEGGNKKGMMYLSMAAGLVLVVGLSIFFMNIMGDKKEMAMESAPTTEQIANEVTPPSDIAPTEEESKAEGKGGEVNTITTTDALAEKSATGGGKDIPDTDSRKKTEDDKGDGLTSRRVVKETKPGQSVADNEAEKDFKQQPETKTTSGPPAGNIPASSPVVMEDKKAEDRKEEANEKNNLDANKQTENEKVSGVKKRAAPKKEKAKSGEALASDDIAANDESTVNSPANISQQTVVGGVASGTGTKRDESGYVHNVEYGNHAYYKPQDYLKVEINKSEMLKTNVKAFKAELTINEKGTVTAVKFLTTFENCTGCKKELEKILLNMPGWKPKSKSAIETVSYIDQ
ncbi:MAG: hypothetical protein KA163_02060 [Bacteroidia bacterium]|nr:hypothetical protein [Bacteroidia bacterium]